MLQLIINLGYNTADLEEEVSNYHINNIKEWYYSLALLINFNNGVPDEEAQAVNRRIRSMISLEVLLMQVNSILAFNEDPERKADIEPIHLPDAHAQYQFLADES